MQTLQVMSALSQPTRMSVWLLLVDRLPEGIPAGDIAKAMGMSKNSMSPHFAILQAAGLVASEKVGRTVIYSARTDMVESLTEYLAHAIAKARAS